MLGGDPLPRPRSRFALLDTNQTFTSVSDDAGFYAVPSLPPGRYELTVNYAGFGKYTRTGVALSVGQTATVNVTLKVAAVSGDGHRDYRSSGGRDD